MNFFTRMMLFFLVAGLTLGSAIVGCDSDSKNDKNILVMALALFNEYTPTKIYIYNGGTHDGDFGDRAAADTLCQTAAAGFTALSGKSVKKAFISFSATDQIKDLVVSQYSSLPVYGLKTDGTETLLKDTWNNLWTISGIGDTLQNTTGIDDGWWSGSTTNGSFSGVSASCNAWTCTDSCSPAASGEAGRYGDSSAATWLSDLSYACSSLVYFLCVAY